MHDPESERTMAIRANRKGANERLFSGYVITIYGVIPPAIRDRSLSDQLVFQRVFPSQAFDAESLGDASIRTICLELDRPFFVSMRLTLSASAKLKYRIAMIGGCFAREASL